MRLSWQSTLHLFDHGAPSSLDIGSDAIRGLLIPRIVLNRGNGVGCGRTNYTKPKQQTRSSTGET